MFATTRWSVVLAAGARDGDGRAALSELCAVYWYPVYAFVRRGGRSDDDARDLTQEFFARLIGGPDLARMDPALGRFRAWLVAALKHFLANEHARAIAQKRGGGAHHTSLDAEVAAEGPHRYALELVDDVTPETLFHRRFALDLVDRALRILRDQHVAAGNLARFEALRPSLAGRRDEGYDDVARTLGITPEAAKEAARRLRQRLKTVMRGLVGDVVDDPGKVDDEIRALLESLT